MVKVKKNSRKTHKKESPLFPSPQADPAEPKTTQPRGHQNLPLCACA